jgi:aminopeptidase
MALAEILVDYSVQVKKNDRVRISVQDQGLPLVKEVYKLCLKRGAIIRVNILSSELDPIYYDFAAPHQIQNFPELDMAEAKWLNCSINIYGKNNTRNMSSVLPEKMTERARILKPVRDHIVKNTRWVICNYPSFGLAQDAEMSLEEYADFLFSATNINWNKMSQKQTQLKKVLDQGKDVRIKGKGTDLRFSIRGRKGIRCDGHRNMPDGEVFIAPDEMSVQGTVLFDFPAIYRGREVDGVELTFEKGLCIKAKAGKNENYLNAMLDSDQGARRIGEFGVGMNYGITKFTKDILFDEKIGGTVHLAMGMAYEEGGGKNKSALHWDMIKDLRRDGEILIDGKVIEKNGKLLV